MITALLLSSVLLSAPAETGSQESDLAAYQEATAGIGRDSGAHRKLALWCEAHGLEAERLKQLSLAVLIDPRDAAARGLLGLVAYRGRWLRPDAVNDRVAADAELGAKLAEYNARRTGLAETADAQWKLALWCEQTGLAPEAQAHFAAVTRLDPSREAAWKRLGCKKHNGRWMSEGQIDAERDEAEAQRKADAHWKPLLARWRGWLGNKDKHAEADEALAGVNDPHAVPSIWAVFVEGGEKGQARAVTLLGQIDAPRASRALALLSVFSDSAEVRRTAIETLRGRDTREYLAPVIALLRKRVKYEVRPVGGPGAPGVLFVEGQRFNVQRLYAPPPMPNIPLQLNDVVYLDDYGMPVISRYLGTTIKTHQSSVSQQTDLAPYFSPTIVRKEGLNPRRFNAQWREVQTTTTTSQTPVTESVQIPIGQLMLQYQRTAMVAQQQLSDDLKVVEDYNAVVGSMNDRATRVLKDVTGQDLGEDPQSWTSWWVDQLGYSLKSSPSQPVPTVVQNVPLAMLPQGVSMPVTTQVGLTTTTTTTTSGIGHSCFKVGTPVHTLGRTQPIESIRVGDQVLTQDVTTGALGYQPVVAVYHNRPAATLRIDLEEGEPIVSTTIHRFWKAGHGWVMARDLKPGDTLRTLGGLTRVTGVESDQVQPVFNLQVAAGGNFFVGATGTLAHDNSLVDPVSAPFDAPPSLGSVVARKK